MGKYISSFAIAYLLIVSYTYYLSSGNALIHTLLTAGVLLALCVYIWQINKRSNTKAVRSHILDLCVSLDKIKGCFFVQENERIIYKNHSFNKLTETITEEYIVEKISNNDAILLQDRSNLIYLNLEADKKTTQALCFSWKIMNYICNLLIITPTPAIENNSNILTSIELSPIPMVIIKNEGTVVKSNNALDKLISDKAKIPNIRNIRALVSESSLHNFNNTLDHINKSNNETDYVTCEVKINHTDELTTLFYLNRFAYGNKDEILIHIIDISEQKNLEMHIAHSQKMQALGQLAGGIAHDFNNLLTAMQGFCDLLIIKHPPGDKSYSDIMQIKQNTNRAANLVRQLLAFSKKQILQPEILDLTDIIAELSNLIRRLIGENIELKIYHGRDLKLVKADQGQLEQVIINLAVNARDAMKGRGILSIKTQNVTVKNDNDIDPDLTCPVEKDKIEKGDYVAIEVTDSGCGIAPEILSKIFEPFFTTKSIDEGTGLGLSTVYGIIKQTGGYIYVSSHEDTGTKFCIFLKAHNEDFLPYENNIIKESKELLQSDLTGNSTILIVEDEEPVRAFSACALRNKGYKILEAADGQEALEVMSKHGKEIDLIISDVIMPGLNGPDLAKRIYELHPDMKIIFMSGYAEDIFASESLDANHLHFLQKPFSLKQLASKVKEVILLDSKSDLY